MARVRVLRSEVGRCGAGNRAGLSGALGAAAGSWGRGVWWGSPDQGADGLGVAVVRPMRLDDGAAREPLAGVVEEDDAVAEQAPPLLGGGDHRVRSLRVC